MSFLKPLGSTLSLVLVLVFATPPVTAADKPPLGFSMAVAVTDAAKPTIGKLTVSGITKGSPADAAGLRTGDEIIEINSKPAVGAAANEVVGRIKGTKTGEHLRFKVKRSDGSMATVDIIAG